MLADVTVDGPAEVTIGQEATFNVSVTFDGAPYPADKLAAVKYLVFDANNAVVVSGDATAGAAGVYTITLPAADSSKLSAGSSKLEVVVTSLVVSIPKIVDFEFIAK
jgi:peptide/nickel transport system substrate-binding protein